MLLEIVLFGFLILFFNLLLLLYINTVILYGVQLASIRLMSGQVSRGSAREYQADERAGVVGLSWRVSG